MKILFSLIFSLTALVQTSAQDKIEGVGKFKINKTHVDIIEEIAIQQRTTVAIIDTKDKEERARGKIYEVKRNTDDPTNSPYKSSKCPAVRIFHIQDYEIADIAFKNIELRFYNDVLIRFSCDCNEEIVKAMETKYGPPKRESESKPATNCPGYTEKLIQENGMKVT